MSIAPSPACFGFSTSLASKIAPAQVPKVGFVADELFQLFEPGFAQQLKKSPGLAAGDDQAVNVIELFGLLDQHNFGTQLFEPAAVRVKIALQGQDSNSHVSNHEWLRL